MIPRIALCLAVAASLVGAGAARAQRTGYVPWGEANKPSGFPMLDTNGLISPAQVPFGNGPSQVASGSLLASEMTARTTGDAELQAQINAALDQLAGFIPISKIGVPNGVASTDANGTIGTNNVLAQGGSTIRTLNAKLGDYITLADLGVVMNGSAADEQAIQTYYDALSSNGSASITIPSGQWPIVNGAPYSPTKSVSTKYVLWDFPNTPTYGGNPLDNPIGDGDVSRYFSGGRYTFDRTVKTGFPYQPEVLIRHLNLSNQYPPFFSTGEFNNVPALEVAAVNGANTTGQVNGIFVNLQSNGNNPFAAEDQGINTIVLKNGQNSTWQYSGLTEDQTFAPPNAFSMVGSEIDLQANGPDCAYDTFADWQNYSNNPSGCIDTTGYGVAASGSRFMLYLAGKVLPTNSYGPGNYTAGETIAVLVGTANQIYMAVNSGTEPANPTPPTWPIGGQVTDAAGITWKYQEPYVVGIAKAIWVDGGKNSQGFSDVRYGTALSSNAVYLNAFMDFSTSQFDVSTTTGAALRIPQNSPIDFTGNGTKAGQNNHILQWSTFCTCFAYNATINGASQSLFQVVDTTGRVNIAGPAVIGTSSLADLHGISTGFNPSAITIAHNMTSFGEEDIVGSPNGIDFWATAVDGSVTTPYLEIAPSGVTDFGTLSVGGTTSLASFVTMANTVNGKINGKTTGYNPAGLTVGWDLSGVNSETDLLVNGNGLNIYTVNSSGVVVPSSPIFSLTGSGNMKVTGTIQSGSTVFASLPACSAAQVGQEMIITDGSNVVWHTPAAGGGTGKTAVSKVLCDGTEWEYE